MPHSLERLPPRPKRYYRLRLYSPLGHYPTSDVVHERCSLVIHEDLIYSIVFVQDNARHGVTLDHYAEFDFLALEEIRFLAAISLALRPDDGAFYTYPLPIYKDVPARPGLDGTELRETAQEFARSLSPDRFVAATAPPLMGGPSYPFHVKPLDERVFRAVNGTKS